MMIAYRIDSGALWTAQDAMKRSLRIFYVLIAFTRHSASQRDG